ncbi:hypothetical protein [Nocardia salmonicida]
MQAPEVGWTSGETWGVLPLAAALLVGFVVIQSRRDEPLIRLSVFRGPDSGIVNVNNQVDSAADKTDAAV